VQVEWTAFKTSAKTPVKGSFKKLDVTSPKGGASTLRGVLERSSIAFDPREIETGDTARDATLRAAFFGLWKEKRIAAKILSAELNSAETSGALSVRITANGVRREIPMKLGALEAAASALPRFTVEGQIQIADFDLQGPFATLHGACEKLHAGPDGVSKTWDTVEIRFSFPVVRNCVAAR
jgi:polyisoprenoid-binding protein YceI